MNYRAERFLRHAVTSLGSLLTLTQCSMTIDDDRIQCSTDRDCTKRGGAFASSVCQDSVCVSDPTWECVPRGVPEQSSDQAASTIRLPLIDVLDLTPFPDVVATVCNKIDTECENPVGAPVTSDADGVLELELPTGFSGYLSLSHESIGPSLYFFNPPVRGDMTAPPVRLASLETAQSLVGLVGGEFDPTRAFIVVTAEDCVGAPAEGVSFSGFPRDDATVPFYSKGHLPTLETTETDESGYGGLIGARPGSSTVTMTHPSLGVVGEFTMLTKSSTISYARMIPSAVD